MMALVFPLSLYALIAAAGLAFWRLVKGPHAADRAVALDLLSLIFASLIAVHAAWTGDSTSIDIVLVLMFIAFFGTIMFARFIERRGLR